MGNRKCGRRMRARGGKLRGAADRPAPIDALATAAGDLPPGAGGGLSGLTTLSGLTGLGMRGLVGLGGLGLMMGAPAVAGPEGGVVTQGAAAIQRQGSQTVITQQTDRAALSWKSFDIGAGEGVEFRQPSTSSIALNTINSRRPTEIQGSLTANGQVWLQNPQGILFGRNATVNVGGLLATSGQIDERAFAEGAGRLDVAGGQGAIINDGALVAGAGGIALVAPVVENHGAIRTTGGDVDLAATDRFAVDFGGDGLLSIQVSAAEAEALALVQDGTIRAEGGVVRLTAAQAEAVRDSLVSVGGMVEATGIAEVGGEIVITGGEVAEITGEIAATRGDRGGRIAVDAGAVEVGAGARLDVSGPAGGGRIDIGRNPTPGPTLAAALAERMPPAAPSAAPPPPQRITVARGATLAADATERGDAGTIVFWSTEATDFSGFASVAARGVGDAGFIDISSAGQLGFDGTVDLTAVDGAAGTLLFDPRELIVADMGGDAGDAELTNGDPSANVIAANEPDRTGTLTVNVGTLQTITTGTIVLEGTERVEFRDPLALSGTVNLAVNQGEVLRGGTNTPATGEIVVDAPIGVAGGTLTFTGDTIDINAEVSAFEGITLSATQLAIDGNLTALSGTVDINAATSFSQGDLTTASVTVGANVNMTAGQVIPPAMMGDPETVIPGDVTISADDTVVYGAGGRISATGAIAITSQTPGALPAVTTGATVGAGTTVTISGNSVDIAGDISATGALTITGTTIPGMPMAMPAVDPVPGNVSIDTPSLVASEIMLDADGSVTILANTLTANDPGGAGIVLDAGGGVSLNARTSAPGTLIVNSSASLSIQAPGADVRVGDLGRPVSLGVDGGLAIGTAGPVGSLELEAGLVSVGSIGSGDFDVVSAGFVDIDLDTLSVAGGLDVAITVTGSATMAARDLDLAVNGTGNVGGALTLAGPSAVGLGGTISAGDVSITAGAASVAGALAAASLDVSATADAMNGAPDGSVSVTADLDVSGSVALAAAGGAEAGATLAASAVDADSLSLVASGSASVELSGTGSSTIAGAVDVTGGSGGSATARLGLSGGASLAAGSLDVSAGFDASVDVAGDASLTSPGHLVIAGDVASFAQTGGTVDLGSLEVAGSGSGTVTVSGNSDLRVSGSVNIDGDDGLFSASLAGSGSIDVGDLALNLGATEADLVVSTSAGATADFARVTLGSGGPADAGFTGAGDVTIASGLTVSGSVATLAATPSGGGTLGLGDVTVRGDTATLTANPTGGTVTLGATRVSGSVSATADLVPGAGAAVEAASLAVQSATVSLATLGASGTVLVTGTVGVSGGSATLAANPAGGSVTVSGSATVSGGSEATAILAPDAGATVDLAGLAVQSATVSLATLGDSGTVTVGGVSVSGGSATLTAAPASDTVTVSGIATVSAPGGTSLLDLAPGDAGVVSLGGALVSGAGATISAGGSGTVSAGGTATVSGGLARFAATLAGDGSATFADIAVSPTVGAAAPDVEITLADTAAFSAGAVTVAASGTPLANVSLDAASGTTLEAARVAATAAVGSASVSVTGGGAITVADDVSVRAATTATLVSTVTGSFRAGSLDVDGDALASVAGPMTVTNTATVTSSDTAQLTAAGTGTFGFGAVVVSGSASGSVDFAPAAGSSVTAGPVSVSGTAASLALGGEGAITLTGTASVSGDDALFRASLSGDATATLADVAVSGGTGTATADLTVQLSGTAGFSAGHLGLGSTSGSLTSEIAIATEPGTNFAADSVEVSVDDGTAIVSFSVDGTATVRSGGVVATSSAGAARVAFAGAGATTVDGSVAVTGAASATLSATITTDGSLELGSLAIATTDPGSATLAAIVNTGAAPLQLTGTGTATVDAGGGVARVDLSGTATALDAAGDLAVTGAAGVDINGELAVAGLLSATADQITVDGGPMPTGISIASLTNTGGDVALNATTGDVTVSFDVATGTASISGDFTLDAPMGDVSLDFVTVAAGPSTATVGGDLTLRAGSAGTSGSASLTLTAGTATISGDLSIIAPGDVAIELGDATLDVDTDLTVVSDTNILIQQGAPMASASVRGVLEVAGDVSLGGSAVTPAIIIGTNPAPMANTATIAIAVDGMFDAGDGTGMVDITAESLSVGAGMAGGLALSGSVVMLALETVDVVGAVELTGQTAASFRLTAPSAAGPASVGGLNVQTTDATTPTSASVVISGNAGLSVGGSATVSVPSGTALVDLTSASIAAGPALGVSGSLTVRATTGTAVIDLAGAVATGPVIDVAGDLNLSADQGITLDVVNPGDLAVSGTLAATTDDIVVNSGTDLDNPADLTIATLSDTGGSVRLTATSGSVAVTLDGVSLPVTDSLTLSATAGDVAVVLGPQTLSTGGDFVAVSDGTVDIAVSGTGTGTLDIGGDLRIVGTTTATAPDIAVGTSATPVAIAVSGAFAAGNGTRMVDITAQSLEVGAGMGDGLTLSGSTVGLSLQTVDVGGTVALIGSSSARFALDGQSPTSTATVGGLDIRVTGPDAGATAEVLVTGAAPLTVGGDVMVDGNAGTGRIALATATTAGAALSATGDVRVLGGTLATVDGRLGAGSLLVSGSAASASFETVDVGGTVVVAGSASARFALEAPTPGGPATVGGLEVIVGGPGASATASLFVGGSATLLVGGDVTVDGNAGLADIDLASAGEATALSATGDLIVSGGRVDVDGELTAAGVFSATAPDIVVDGGAAADSISVASISGTGGDVALRASSGSVVVDLGGEDLAVGGALTLEAVSGSVTVVIDGQQLTTEGTLSAVADTSVAIAASGTGSGTITVGGDLDIGGTPATVTLGSLATAPAVTVSGSFTAGGPGTAVSVTAASLGVGDTPGAGIALSGSTVALATTGATGTVTSGPLGLTSSGSATLAGVVSADSLAIDAVGDILVSGSAHSTTGAADLDGGAQVTIRSDAFTAGSIDISATGDVSIRNDGTAPGTATVSANGPGGTLAVDAGGAVTIAAVGSADLEVSAADGAAIDGGRVVLGAQLTAADGTVTITSADDLVVGRTVPATGTLTGTAGGIATQGTGVGGDAIALRADGDLVILGDVTAASGDISGVATGLTTASAAPGNIFVEGARTIRAESVSFDAAADFTQGTVIGGQIPAAIVSDGVAADGIVIEAANVRVFQTLVSSGTIELRSSDPASGSVAIRPQQPGDTLNVDGVIPPVTVTATPSLTASGTVTLDAPTVTIASATLGTGDLVVDGGTVSVADAGVTAADVTISATALTIDATTLGSADLAVSATSATVRSSTLTAASVDLEADTVLLSATALSGAGITVSATAEATIDGGSLVNAGDTAVAITAEGDVVFAPTTATVSGTLDIVSTSRSVFFAPRSVEVSGTGNLRIAGATGIATALPEGVGTSGSIAVATTGDLTIEASGAGDDPTVTVAPNGGPVELSVGGDLAVAANSGSVTLDALADAGLTSSVTGAALGVAGGLDVTGGDVAIVDTDPAGTGIFDVGAGATVSGGDVRLGTLLRVASGSVVIGATGVGSGTAGVLEIGQPGPAGGPVTASGTVGGIAALDPGAMGVAIDLDAAGDLRIFGSATAESGDLDARAGGSIFVEASREVRADSVGLFAAERFVQATILGASDNATIVSQGGATDGITIEGVGVEIYGRLESSGSVSVTNLAGGEVRDLVIGPQPAGGVNAAGTVTTATAGPRFSLAAAPGIFGEIVASGTVEIDNRNAGSVTRIDGDVTTTGDLVIDEGEELRIGETRPATLRGATVLLSQSDLVFVGDAASSASATVVEATDTGSTSATLTLRAPNVDIGRDNRFIATIGSLELVGDGSPAVIGGTSASLAAFDNFGTATLVFGPDAEGFASLTSDVVELTVQNLDTTGGGDTRIGVLELGPRPGSTLASLTLATESQILIAGPVAGSDNADPASATTQFSLFLGSEDLMLIPSEILIDSVTDGSGTLVSVGRIGVNGAGELRPVNELTFLSRGDVTSQTGLIDDSVVIAASGLATVDIEGEFVLENTTSDRVPDGNGGLVPRSEIVDGTDIRRLVRGEPSEGAVFDGGLRIEDASRVEVYGSVNGFDGAQAVSQVEVSDSFDAEVVPEVGDGAPASLDGAVIGQINDCDIGVACSFAPEFDGPLMLETDEDTGALIDVAGAAIDPIEGDPSTIIEVDGVAFADSPQIPGPEGGVFVINDGQLEFRPQGGLDQLAEGETISFTVPVTVQDLGLDIATGSLTVTVIGVNDAPVPQPEVVLETNAANLSQSVFPGLIATDAEGDPIRFLTIGGTPVTPNTTIPLAGGGVIVVAANGSIRFNPNGQFAGVPQDEINSSTVVATVTDGNEVNATANLVLRINVIGVNPDNQAPVPLGGSISTEADMASNPILAGSIFADPEMEFLQLVSINGQPVAPGSTIPLSGGGQLVVGPNGALSFDPNGDFTDLGVGEMTSFGVGVTVTDPLNLAATAQLTITVTGVEGAGPGMGDFDLMPGELVLTEDMASSPFQLSALGAEGLRVATINGVEVMPGSTVEVGAGGRLLVNADGSLTFDPGDDFQSLGNGQSRRISLDLGLVNAEGLLDATRLNVTVGGINDAPVQTFGELTTTEDLPSGVIGPDGIAVDLEMDAVQITAIEGQPVMPGSEIVTAQGVLRVDADGQIVFDPSGAFEQLGLGEATEVFFEITVTDAFGATSSGPLRVVVTGENDNPLAVPASLETNEDTPSLGLDPGQIGIDPEMDMVRILAIEGQDPTMPVALPGGGTLVVDSAGNLIFDPAGEFEALGAGQSGLSSARVTLVDPQGATVEATITIGIQGVNDVPAPAPAPNPDTGPEVPTDQDEPSMPVPPDDVGVDPDQDTDLRVIQIDGQDVTVGTVVDLGGGASVALDANGELVFSPGTNFVSLAEGQTQIVTLIVTLADESGATTTAPVSFVIVGVNDGPVFLVEAVATTEDMPSQGLRPGDLASDPENDAIALLRVGDQEIAPGGAIDLPNGGVLRLTEDGQLVFDPTDNFEGLGSGQEQSDTIRITLTDALGAETEGEIVLRVTGENDPPLANMPVGSTTEDGPAPVFTPLDLATDVDTGDMLSIVSINGQPIGADGSVTLDDGSVVTIGPDGRLSFDPGPAFQSLSEGASGSVTLLVGVTDSAGAETTVALIVDIAGLNDAPTLIGTGGMLSTDQNTPGVLAPFEFVVDPDQGDVLGIVSVNGILPGPDGSVTLSDGSVVSLGADGSLVFVPGAEFRSLAEAQEGGLDLVLRVADRAGAELEVPVSVQVVGLNDAPTGGTATLQTVQTTPTDPVPLADLLGDPDMGDVLRIVSAGGLPVDADGGVTLADGSRIVVDATGNLVFLPSEAFLALPEGDVQPVTLTLSVADAAGAAAELTLVVDVAGVNDAPRAADDGSFATSPFEIVVLDVLGNDLDLEGDALTITDVEVIAIDGVALATFGPTVGGGEFRLDDNGNLIFDPAGDFADLAIGETRTLTFLYTVEDSLGASDSAIASVTVEGTEFTLGGGLDFSDDDLREALESGAVPTALFDQANTQAGVDAADESAVTGDIATFGFFNEITFIEPTLDEEEPVTNRADDEIWPTLGGTFAAPAADDEDEEEGGAE